MFAGPVRSTLPIEEWFGGVRSGLRWWAGVFLSGSMPLTTVSHPPDPDALGSGGVEVDEVTFDGEFDPGSG